MVQFGQTLNDVVKNEPNWRSHAVPYMALKQVLRTNNTTKDDDSTHTDSSYTITTSQKTKFGKLFDDSVIKLVSFYKEKAQQANLKYVKLEQEVNMCLGGAVGVDISLLIDRISEFSQDVKLTMEFLELNVMAYSKIMKKVCRSPCIVGVFSWQMSKCTRVIPSSLTNAQDYIYENIKFNG